MEQIILMKILLIFFFFFPIVKFISLLSFNTFTALHCDLSQSVINGLADLFVETGPIV